ncbi:MAG: GNAT family N-acetyltransferase [Gemmatimonadaceae bacterium]
MSHHTEVAIRNMTERDFDGIIAITGTVYPGALPWSREQLTSHLRVFPDGQFVAERLDTGEIVGMAASLIVLWDDYDLGTSWRDFTAAGMFTNHDPERGRTLYGAEVMVGPALQGHGIGSKLYAAREQLVRERGLLRIRAGARLRDYGIHARGLSGEAYVRNVLRGTLIDRTLTFQLRRGFRVIGVIDNYLRHDPESLGRAAVIEWVNRDVAGAAYDPPVWR